MLYLSSVHAAPGVRSALAVACGLALSMVSGAVHAADDETDLGPIVVTASRMPQLLQTAPIGATVITSEQIQRAGVADANEAVRKLGGVAAKSDLTSGREFILDLRGYGGESASQNMVVLVDGVRISENELAFARLTAIPLELIDRIEIVRGGGSVMWGEGASAGVVNVILKKPVGDVRLGKLGAAIESQKGHEATAFGQWGLGGWAFDASAKRVRNDGFRDNGFYKQDVGSAGVQWSAGGSRVGMRVQHEEQKGGLPGPVSYQRYLADRRAASTPDNYGGVRQTRYVVDASQVIGPLTAQLDAALRERETVSFYSYAGLPNTSSSQQHQVTPRLAYAADWGSAKVSGMAGVEWQGWRLRRVRIEPPESYQDNRALFAQGDVRLASGTRVTAGWREEHVHRFADVYRDDRELHAGEFGLNQTIRPGVDVYGRLASSYRIANADEYGYQQTTVVRPQRNRDKEIGLKWAQGGAALTARYFVQKTEDEIAFNPLTFLNENLDPTQRRGTELEGRWSPVGQLTISATWQQLTARMRGGRFAGKDIVLVSPHSGTLRGSYRVDDHQTLDAGVQYQSAKRSYGDYDNACSSKVPSATLFDARYAWSDRTWTVALSATNLADRKGYGYDYSFGCDAASVYPYAGRSVKLAVSRQF